MLYTINCIKRFTDNCGGNCINIDIEGLSNVHYTGSDYTKTKIKIGNMLSGFDILQ